MGERILFIGAGAVGGYVGGHLARDGHDVILADPWPEHVEAMRSRGLSVNGVTAEECFVTPVRALHLTELQALAREPAADIAFVSVKAYDTSWAAALANLYLAPEGFAVSLQNGINEDLIAAVLGWGRTAGCIANKIVVELSGPGEIHRRVSKGGQAHTVFRAGEIHGRITPRIERVRALLASVDSAVATPNLWGERWSKLVQNAMANGLSAATGMSAKEYHDEPMTRRLSIRLAGEAVQVGLAQGYALELIGGLDPQAWVDAAAELDSGANDTPVLDEVEGHMLASAARMSAAARPSMGQDMLKGRRTEIDDLNGLVVRRGQETGVPTPANAGLVAAVRRVEHGQAPAAPERVAGI